MAKKLDRLGYGTGFACHYGVYGTYHDRVSKMGYPEKGVIISKKSKIL